MNRYKVHMTLILVQAAHVVIAGVATPEEAVEQARAAVSADAVLTQGAPSIMGYEIRETERC